MEMLAKPTEDRRGGGGITARCWQLQPVVGRERYRLCIATKRSRHDVAPKVFLPQQHAAVAFGAVRVVVFVGRVEVTQPMSRGLPNDRLSICPSRVLGSGRCAVAVLPEIRGDYAGGVFAVYSAAGRVPP